MYGSPNVLLLGLDSGCAASLRLFPLDWCVLKKYVVRYPEGYIRLLDCLVRVEDQASLKARIMDLGEKVIEIWLQPLLGSSEFRGLDFKGS
jgi:hypothetical protein